MPILIDGYNLMYAAGLMRVGDTAPGALERGRRALLNLLAASLPEETRRATIVVFDAADAPSHLPTTARFKQLEVRFAANHEDADALLEELIAQSSAPKQLTVVSSDNRIRRAALRRRATAQRSELWIDQLRERRKKSPEPSAPRPAKPSGELSPEEINFWLNLFSEDDAPPESPQPGPDEADTREEDQRSPRKDASDMIDDIFPADYFDEFAGEDDEDASC